METAMTKEEAINKELFEKVKQHILTDPRRYNQRRFGEVSDDAPCGTACCIAGWAIVLSGGATHKDAQLDFEHRLDAFDTGAALLGLSDEEAEAVFCAYGEDWPEPFKTDFSEATNRHGKAKAAAAYIDHIIKTGKVT
jgi:hypothetical protein